MEVQYIYFLLGIVLGLLISLYLYLNREEKIMKIIMANRKEFSTDKLDAALEKAVDIMKNTKKSLNRELTEEEKDKIITNCIIENKS